jgi:dihydrofolate synthase / folylpolyglutamate synthase
VCFAERLNTNLMIDALLHQLETHKLPTIDLKLERVLHFLRCIGNPQDRLAPVIHVAGTNGKGSVIAFCHAMLMQAGKTAHRYTSPHLVRFNERIMLNNQIIEDARLMVALERSIRQQQEHNCPLTYFESTTIMALELFADTPADAVLLEVGLGGRLDATNVVEQPLACVITPIDLDHQAYLGNTIALIAAEKAGIIKAGVPVIVGRQPADALHVIQAKATEMGAASFCMNKDWNYSITEDGGIAYHSDTLSCITPAPAMQGAHQYDNAATAIAVMDVVGQSLGVRVEAIQQGLAKAEWAGRLQLLPAGAYNAPQRIYVDGGHNPHAARALQEWCKKQEQPVHVICGMRDDKDAKEVVALLCYAAASFIAVNIPNEAHSMPAKTLHDYAVQHHHTVASAASVTEAVQHISQKNDHLHIILICGSLYLTGAVLGEVT